MVGYTHRDSLLYKFSVLQKHTNRAKEKMGCSESYQTRYNRSTNNIVHNNLNSFSFLFCYENLQSNSWSHLSSILSIWSLTTSINDKLNNNQKLKYITNSHTNQDFNRNYSYGSVTNQLIGFTVNSTLYENLYDPNRNLLKEVGMRYLEWDANDKLAVFKNQAGTSTPSVYTNYFYNSQGERVKKHTRKGNKVTVTFYMDGGMFETSYVKPTGGSIDNNRFYNTIKISDDGALIATTRVG